jgi:hypothetical protein
VFVNGLWYFRGARTTAILYHVHHNQTEFLHLYLRFWLAHRHPALPTRSGLPTRSRTARGRRLPDSAYHLSIILSMRCDSVLETLMGRLHRCLLRVHSALPAVPSRLSLRVIISTSSFAGVGPLRRSAPSPSKVMPVTS